MRASRSCSAVLRLHLEAQADARPARRQRQPLHDRLCRRDEQDRLLASGKTAQDRTPPAGDLARRFQPIERQIIQSGEYENIERWIECMDDAAEPLGPVLVFSEKHQPIATGLFPLLAKMQRQHAKRRGRRDRGNSGFSGFFGRAFGRAFSGRAAGADLPAFLHETSIVIREPWWPANRRRNTSYPLSTLPQDCRARPDASSLIDPLSRVRFESEYDRCHRDWSVSNGRDGVTGP